MKLKPGFYMEDDGTIWLVYPDGKVEFTKSITWEDTYWSQGDICYLLVSEKTYIGL